MRLPIPSFPETETFHFLPGIAKRRVSIRITCSTNKYFHSYKSHRENNKILKEQESNLQDLTQTVLVNPCAQPDLHPQTQSFLKTTGTAHPKTKSCIPI